MNIYNFPKCSPNVLSGILVDLNVSHRVYNEGRMMRSGPPRRRQPRKVIITTSIPTSCPNAIVFTCIPECVLSYIAKGINNYECNEEVVKNILITCKPTQFELHDVSPESVIEQVSPPMFLDYYQTIQCKINPYSLRVQAQKQAIDFLNGGTVKAAKEFFSSSLKLETLGALVLGESGRRIREAIMRVHKGESLSSIADEYLLDKFQIRYIILSRERRMKENQK